MAAVVLLAHSALVFFGRRLPPSPAQLPLPEANRLNLRGEIKADRGEEVMREVRVDSWK